VTTVAEWVEWHLRRQIAAVRFMQAADHVRVLTQLAQSAGMTEDIVPPITVDAVRDAERACADLRLWPHWGGRAPRYPERFRETGDLAA
jgi:hypothetical protein